MHDRIGRAAGGGGAWARHRPPRLKSPPPNWSRPRRVTASAASVIRVSWGGGSGGRRDKLPGASYHTDGTRPPVGATSGAPNRSNAMPTRNAEAVWEGDLKS